MMDSLKSLNKNELEALEIAKARIRAEQARSYQLELFEYAKKNNTIVVLGTGTGKTFISVLLLKHMEHQVTGPWRGGECLPNGKRSVFLAPTVPLVEQQCEVLRRHLSVKVGVYVGAMQVDLWSEHQWDEEFEQYGVLVMTPAVFDMALDHGFLPLDRVNVLVLDECHRATKDDPYVRIMKTYKTLPLNRRPRVLGLTASAVNAQVRGALKVCRLIRQLEATLFATAKTASGSELFGTKPTEIIAAYGEVNVFKQPDKKSVEISSNATIGETLPINDDLLSSLKSSADFKEFQRSVTALKQMYVSCGSYCTKLLLTFREQELDQALKSPDCTEDFHASSDIKKKIYASIQSFLGELSSPLEGLSPKMRRLLDILAPYRDIIDNVPEKANCNVDEVVSPSETEDSRRLSAVVFVKERMSAYVLYRWLTELSLIDEKWNFIRCSFIVGNNQSPFSKDCDYNALQLNSRAQRKVMNDFRNGIYNLLFATSVIEEGVDVPACNLIVRFDLPADVRSYTQSKGRARAKRSLYVMMADQAVLAQVENLVENFQETEQLVVTACEDSGVAGEHSRAPPDLFESHALLEDDPDLPAFVHGSARISAHSAISILHWYCQTFAGSGISGDQYMNIMPRFECETVATAGGSDDQHIDSNGLLALSCTKNGDDTATGYTCLLSMPLVTPVWRERVSTPRPFASKNKARAYVALQMCRVLHARGELTERLLPRPRIYRLQQVPPSDSDIRAEENLKRVAIKSGNQLRYVFSRKCVRQLCTQKEDLGQNSSNSSEFREFHLYAITTTVVRWADSSQRRQSERSFDPQAHSTWMGLLLRERISDNIPKFPIFTRSGEEEVGLVYAGPVKLSIEAKLTCARFHRYIFLITCNMADATMEMCDPNTFFTPCVVAVDAVTPKETERDAFALNFEVMRSVGAPIEPDYDCFEFDEQLFTDAVVELLYHINENLPEYSSEVHERVPSQVYHRYYVKSTCARDSDGKPLTPRSTGYYMFNQSLSFADYVAKKHIRKGPKSITNENQHVLEVEHVQERLEMTLPRFNSIKKKSDFEKDGYDEAENNQNCEDSNKENIPIRDVEYVLPQFTVVHALKASVWRKATSLPTILYRLNRLLVAEELRQDIAVATGLGSSTNDSKVAANGRLLTAAERWPPIQLEAISDSCLPQISQQEFGKLMADTARKFDQHKLLKSLPDFIYSGLNFSEARVTTDLPSSAIQASYASAARPNQAPAFPSRVNESDDFQSLSIGLRPSPGDLMKALSTRSAHDLFDFERFELLGDAFLEIAVTLSLIDQHPDLTARELATRRQYFVCNRHLLYRAFQRGLTNLVETVRFQARLNFLPPGFFENPLERRLLEPDFLRVFISSYDYDTLTGDPLLKDIRFAKYFTGMLAEVDRMSDTEFVEAREVNFLTGEDLPVRAKLPVKRHQDYKAKVAGDVTEALIGVYVETCGCVGGLKLIDWLGIPCTSPSTCPAANMKITSNFLDAYELSIFTSNRYAASSNELLPFLHHINDVEVKLGYTFKNKTLALEAITHNSCTSHALTPSNCKLAYLGEAVVGFLVTAYIYNFDVHLGPGQMTELRSAITNTQVVAHAIVKTGLHSNFLYGNSKLFAIIRRYVDNIDEVAAQRFNTVLDDEEATDNFNQAEVPRPLARLFYALMGAVFVDAGKSLEEVWTIVVRVMGYEMTLFSKNVPVNPVRELVTKYPRTRFERPYYIESGENKGLVRVTVHIRHANKPEETYTQIAETKKIAKTILAKKYLRRVERELRLEEIEQKKRASEKSDDVKVLENSLISSEFHKVKHYRKL